jgi:hypothetical protein
MENNKYLRLKSNVKCWKCLGCNKLESPNFQGLYNCDSFKQANKTVWCANEAIDKFMKTGKVKS